MTCIVGLRHQGAVYIGGDSAGVSGWSLEVRADQKVFRNGPYLMGFTTSFRIAPRLPDHRNLDAFMVSSPCTPTRNAGSLHTSKQMAPQRRVRAALTAAADHSAGVAGPFSIRRLAP